MKYLKILTVMFISITFFSSCDSSDEPTGPAGLNIGGGDPTFTLNQNNSNPQELDLVTFSVNSSNGGYNELNWYVNNNQIANGYNDLEYTFLHSGDHTIRAEISYYNSNGVLLNTSLERIINIIERPKYNVKITKVEVLSYADFNDYVYNQYNYCSLKSYFEINELDDYGSTATQHTSSENTENLGSTLYSFEVMDWDITNVNYEAIVYQSGNYYPNNQFYNFVINFHGANDVYGTPYESIDYHNYDLNPYRNTQPSEITFNTTNMSVKLTLEWN